MGRQYLPVQKPFAWTTSAGDRAPDFGFVPLVAQVLRHPTSEVSRICAEMDVDLEACRTRDLTHAAFPCVLCDAT